MTFTTEFQNEFRQALVEHFSIAQVEKLQQRLRIFRDATGIKPMPPDLWLIDRRGNHRFMGVKFRGDRIGWPQLAGLALIASTLRAKTRISVEIIDLSPDRKQQFKGYCDVARG